jgi:hypothetical protein
MTEVEPGDSPKMIRSSSSATMKRYLVRLTISTGALLARFLPAWKAMYDRSTPSTVTATAKMTGAHSVDFEIPSKKGVLP